MRFLSKMFSIGFVLVGLVFVVSCSSQQATYKSSVVDYLYPKEAAKIVEPSIPVLKLPIKLGIAFVPAQSSRKQGYNMWSGNRTSANGLTEIKKMQILGQVSGYFKKYPFIGEIQEIPSSYLTPGGSFANLDQIKTMYGVDVMALVSYDQVQFTDAGFLSVSYWTIVGAYLVSGEKNDTNTLMDTVVYDIASRKMLFRAPGTSIVKGRSTPVNLSEELREDGIKSFDQAAKNMIENLDVQLAAFREKAKQNPEQIKVVKTEGYSGGGGAFDLTSLWILLGVVGVGFLFRKQA